MTTASSGTYKCSVTYKTADDSLSIGPIEKNVNVIVRGFTTQPADTTVDSGAQLDLTCAVAGDAEAAISWYDHSILTIIFLFRISPSIFTLQYYNEIPT